MSQLSAQYFSKTAIDQINSLGGPQLPTGVSKTTLKIIMENIAASQAITNSCVIASALSKVYFQ